MEHKAHDVPLHASQIHSQKIISSLQHKREESFKIGITDLQRRNSLFQLQDNCDNYLNLFDAIQKWKEAPEETRNDTLIYIYKTFVDSTSFQHVPVEEHIVVDMRCLVQKEIDFMPEFRAKEIIDALEKIAVTKLMELEAKTMPNSPRLLSPRASTPRGTSTQLVAPQQGVLEKKWGSFSRKNK
jgi:hypothetical protein